MNNVSDIQFQRGTYPQPNRAVYVTQKTRKQQNDAFDKNSAATKLLAKNETAKKATQNENKTKRFLTTSVLTLSTIVGLAAIGNKSSNSMAKIGQKVDDYLANKNWYKSLEKGWTKCKQKISDFFLKNKSDYIRKSAEDITETLGKRHAQPTLDIARGYGRGFTSIFGLTPADVLRNSVGKLEQKTPGQGLKSLEKLVGKEKAQDFLKRIGPEGKIVDNQAFCQELTEAIAKNFNLKDATGKTDTKQLLDFFLDLQKGKAKGVDFSEFTQVKMQEKGFMGLISSWWPANYIDSAGSKIYKAFGKEWKNIGRGNLGDSLVKFNAVNGTLAKTKAGSLVQQLITVPTESISNFVNDKSGMGVLLSLAIASSYNAMQDAPKEKRAATLADEHLGTLGAIAISTPLAFGATYGLASLKNVEGKTSLTKALRYVGNIFGLGHNKIGLDGKMIENSGKSKFMGSIGKFGGHALRFALIMFVFSSMFNEPIRKGIHKIFGKPHDKFAEDEKQKLAMQQNALQTLPIDLQNLSEAELEQLLQAKMNTGENIFTQSA